MSYIRRLVSPLCAPLHEAFPTAVEQARDVRHDYDLAGVDYDWLGTHLIRGLAHRSLVERRDLGDWRLVGDHQRNGELWLANNTTTIRLLHSLSPDEVPPAGRNPTRQGFYRNPPLFDIQEGLFPINQLLGVWRVVDPETYEVGFRIVRPLKPWPYRRMTTVHVDVDFLLPRDVDQFEDLEFRPTDEDMILNLPDEQEETPDADGLGG